MFKISYHTTQTHSYNTQTRAHTYIHLIKRKEEGKIKVWMK